MSLEDLLFCRGDWNSVDQNQRAKLAAEIAAFDGSRLLNTSVDDLCGYFVEKYKIDVPVLDRDGIVADQQETQIDVGRDPLRLIHDRSRPFHIAGAQIEVDVPFTGDAPVFAIRPTTFSLNPPRAEIRGNVARIRIAGTDLQADRVREQIDEVLNNIESYLSNLRKDAAGFNGQLESLARTAIDQRRTKLLENQSVVSSLGFKIKTRDESTHTYSAPEVRRKIAPKMPAASSIAYKPEPALTDSDYEHILDVIDDMAHVMERSPSAFITMDEESLRSHFLVQLNGHYKGQATGETFNYEGKTDILIRSNGKNIFIAECKYWDGQKQLTETIDQLLGYSSWRDTKVAIIVFNRNKDFTKVLQSIDTAAQSHPNFKRSLGKRSESSFRYVFANRDDPNRELTVTVMAFDVPK